MSGIRRKLGTAPKRKSPATLDHLLMMVSKTADDLQGFRDRALMLFGFASALGRSELAALDVDDLDRTDRGLLVTVRNWPASRAWRLEFGVRIADVNIRGAACCRLGSPIGARPARLCVGLADGTRREAL
jgi:hypothetical protein